MFDDRAFFFKIISFLDCGFSGLGRFGFEFEGGITDLVMATMALSDGNGSTLVHNGPSYLHI